MARVTKVFVSSTFEDLKLHRAHAIEQLRNHGYHVDPMENWSSAHDEPKEFCGQRLADCEFCVLLVAWRRGFVPDGESRSITQLEYDAAIKRGIRVLPFLLHEDVETWPLRFIDKHEGILQWREHLLKSHGAKWFTEDPKSLDVCAAISRELSEKQAATPLPVPPTALAVIGSNFDVPELFTNREQELEGIWKLLCAPRAKKLTFVVGQSGTGKTALVARLCQKIEAGELRHPNARGPLGVDGIVYFDCRGAGPQTVERLFHDLSQLTDPEAVAELKQLWGDSNVKDEVKFRTLLAKLQGGTFLLILDNFEDVLQEDNSIGDESLHAFLEGLLTRPHGLHVVATSASRVLLGGELAARTETFWLDKGLPVAHGVQLLRELDVGGTLGLRDAEERLLHSAVEKCHGLPRALYLIFGLLYADDSLSLKELINNQELFNDQVIINLFREQCRRLSNDRLRVLEALAVYNKPVSLEAITQVVHRFFPRVAVENCLRSLTLSHFVTASRERRTYELQALLRQYVYAQIPEEGGEYNKVGAHRAAADYFASRRTAGETWKSLADIQPVLDEFEQRVLARQFEEAARLVDEIDDEYLQRWGHYRTVIGMREKLLEQLTSPELLQSNYGNLALVCRRTGEKQKSAAYLQRAIEAARAGNLPLALVDWHCELGNTYADLVEMSRAIEQYQLAIDIARQSGHPAAEARPQGNRAIAYRQLGKPQEALECYRKAIEIDEAAIASATDPKERKRFERMRANHIGNSGRAHWALQEYRSALECYQVACDFMHADAYPYAEAVFLGHIGETYLVQRDFERALQYCQQSIDLLKETGERRSMSYVLEWQGLAWHHLGNLDAAAQSYAACRLCDSEETNYSCEVLSAILERERGDKVRQRQHLQQGIELCRQVLSRTPHYYEAIYRLALAHLAGGKVEESLETYRKALAACAAKGVVTYGLFELALLRRTSIAVAEIEQVQDLLLTVCPDAAL